MSVVGATVQSSASTNWTASSSVTITKPTGLEVGDLLVAQVCGQRGDSPQLATPSGWTLVDSSAITDFGAGEHAEIAVFYKVATSGDVSASDFTFTSTDYERMSGGLYRVSGINSVNIIDAYDMDSASTSNQNATITFTGGVNPSFTDTLFLFFTLGRTGTSNFSEFSTYAVTTSNPTWTEAWDRNLNNFPSATSGTRMSSAYAVRAEDTATGDYSFALTSNSTGDKQLRGFLVAIKSKLSVTTNATVVTAGVVTKDARLPIMSIINLVAGVQTPSALSSIWTKVSKAVTSWTKQSK